MTRTNEFAALLALAGCFVLTAGAATFTFKSGATFDGEVVEVKGTNAVIVRSAKDGKLYTIVFSTLTDVDRYAITGHWPGASGNREPSASDVLRAEREKAEAGKALPEQAGNESSDSGQITGAFGLKLGQRFDLKCATTTNNIRTEMTVRGKMILFDMPDYGFKPRLALPHFSDYWVGITPRSNCVYSISALTSSLASDDPDFDAWAECTKLLAVLEDKYGKSDFTTADSMMAYKFKQGSRELVLSYWKKRDGISASLRIDYEDTALRSQARSEHAAIDAADPGRNAERNKLKNQL